MTHNAVLLPSTSVSFSFAQVSYLSLSSSLSFCSHRCTAQRSGWWELSGYSVCLSPSLTRLVYVCVRVFTTAMSLGCVIEMEMSQSATAVVCHLSPALASAFHSGALVFVTRSFCGHMPAIVGPSFRSAGPRGGSVKSAGNNDYLHSPDFISWPNYSVTNPRSVSRWFHRLCVATCSSVA